MEKLNKEHFILPFVFFLLVNNQIYSQCPTVSVVIDNMVCKNQILNIQNSTSNATSYNWEFCAQDLNQVPSVQGIGNLVGSNLPRGIDIIEDNGSWYAFVTSLSNNSLFRIDFGPSLNNSQPTFENLGNISGILNGPQTIKMIKEGQDWYGLILNNTTLDIVRMAFGSNIQNTPTAEVAVSSIGGANSSIDFGIANDSLIVILTERNTSNINHINFGSSITNNPSGPDIKQSGPISGLSGTFDIDLVQDCDQWYGFAVAYTNKKVYKLAFGNSLFATPTLTEVGVSEFGTDNPGRIVVLENGSNYHAIITTLSGNLYRVDLGNDLNNVNDVFTNLGNFGTLGSSFSLGFQKFSGEYIGISLNASSRNISQITFPSNCAANFKLSDQFEPKEIFYSEAGTYNINFTATDIDGNISRFSKSITVLDDFAPDISFSNDNFCISSTNSFSAQNNTPSQTITTWTWDFGDGSPTETGQNATHQYATAGTYEVILQAESDNTCGQVAFQEITIFDEPVPSFTVPAGLKCSNEGLLFTNTTAGDFGDIISWTWDFGDGGSSTEKDPTYAFATAGTHNVKLTASIPGCTAETTISVDVSEGPVVAYSFDNDCFNNSITFTNNTTGADITGYTWDFGDGATSNLVNPTHTFASAGDYTIMLTVDNTLGCSVTNTQTVTVHALPEVAFINELACSNGGTQFFDQTTVAGANVTAWAWDFGDGNISTEKDPIHTYEGDGPFLVSLTATSNFGCVATLEKTVDVIVGPTVDFDINQVCLGEATQFEDLSETSDGTAITSWFWEIDGQVFTEQNPEATFSAPGTYTASLTVTSATFCTATITKDVVINPLPTADFSVENACVRDEVRFSDESIVTGDDIAEYSWDFDGLGSASDANPVFTFDNTGNYNIGLTITTVAGCISTVNKTITILDSPEAAFTTDVSQGPPPLTVNFQNNSAGGDSYDWNFGNGETSSVAHPIVTFTDLGVFETRLVVSTAAGCRDTVTQTINVVEPLMDLALEGMTTLTQDGETQVSLDIRNNGTLFVDKIQVKLQIGPEATVNQTITQTVAPGQLMVYPLNVSVTNRASTPYLCATLTPLETPFADHDQANNTFCINLEEKASIIKPFPNPSDHLVTVGVILQESQKVIITMHNAVGQPVIEKEFPNAPEGLNQFQLDVSGVSDGLYWLKLQYGGSEDVFRMFVDK